MERIGSDTLSQFIFGLKFYLLKLTICSVVTRKFIFIPHSKVTLIVILNHLSIHCGGPGPWPVSGYRPVAACPGSSGYPRQTPSRTRPCKRCLSTPSMSPQHPPANKRSQIKKRHKKRFRTYIRALGGHHQVAAQLDILAWLHVSTTKRISRG